MTEYHRAPPREKTKMAPVATGSQTKSFWITATGSFQPVTLPADMECKSVYIQAHGGDNTEYDIDIGNTGFLFSSESDGTGWARIGVDGISLSLGKIQAQDGGVVGHVKAAAGKNISVLVLF